VVKLSAEHYCRKDCCLNVFFAEFFGRILKLPEDFSDWLEEFAEFDAFIGKIAEIPDIF
jgi:hypothetical protein